MFTTLRTWHRFADIAEMAVLCTIAREGTDTDKLLSYAEGLKADGIVGPKTWEALDEAVGPTPPVTTLYTVHIPHLTEYQADALIATYAGSWKTAEGSE